MKTNITRILCLALVLLMSVTVFSACKKDDTVTKTDVSGVESTVSLVSDVIVDVQPEAPFAIAKDADGKDIVILTPGENGAVIMTVAENTTLEAFLAVVTAKDGFTIKVTDAEGKEVTDAKTVIAKDMVFEVYADGATTSEVKYVIDVVTEEKIQETVKEQEKVESTNSQILASNPGVTPDPEDPKDPDPEDPKDPDPVDPTPGPGPGEPDDPQQIDIVLSSIYGTVYESSDATGTAWQSTFTNMKNNQGITTTVNSLDANSATDTIVKEVMAGKASADIFDISLVMCRNVARKKAAVNIYESETLNKSLYDTAVTESLTFGGKAYGVAFASKSVNPMGVIYNKSMIKKYAPDYDIVELYNTKKWDFNTFQEIAKLCTVDTDGNGKSDIYGFTSNTNIIGMALTANAGGTALMKNGRVEATMCNDAGIAALEWCKTMFKDDKTWKYQADINSCITAFANGEAAMFVSYLQYYQTIASQANFELGFVLMPMGPDQKQYNNGVYDASCFVVPKTKANRLSDIGLWLNGAAAVSSKIINLQVTNLARNGLDATSQSIYKWLVNNMTPEFSSGAFSSEISTQVDSSVTSASKSPSKVMTAIKSQAQKECDDYYGDLY